jgi:hypothetical protein
MARPAVPPVVVPRISDIELPHELRQIRFGGLDNQVKMVAHEHVSVHADSEDLNRAPKPLEKARPVMIVAENQASIVAPASHMIKSVGI